MSLVLKSNVAYTGDVNGLPFLYDMSLVVNAISMVGTRKLSAVHNGALLRVRRSSDNTEKDIYAVKEQLDTASLLAFVGTGNGFVTRLYDQSGNNNDSVMADAARQFNIVNAGALRVSSDGKPCLYSDGLTKQSMLLSRPPTALNGSYLGGFIEGSFKGTGFAAVDARPVKAAFRFDIYAGDVGNFLYRETPTSPTVTLRYDAPFAVNSRYVAALDAVAKKAITKDKVAKKETALTVYEPMASLSSVVIGANNSDGTDMVMKGYFTAFALINNLADGNALLSIIK